MVLQVWNGIEINSTDFRPTLEWRRQCPRENFPADTFAHENWGRGYKVTTYCFPKSTRSFYKLMIWYGMQKWEWQCLADEFQCESGACIPWESMCNGSDDCLIYGLESEDEQWETCDQVMPVNSLYSSFYTHYPYPLSLSIIPICYPYPLSLRTCLDANIFQLSHVL